MGSLVKTPSYYPYLSARENLKLVKRLRGDSPKSVERVLKIVNLLWDSKRSSSFVLAMAVGITATIQGVILFGHDMASFYPWTLPGVVALDGTESSSIWLLLSLGCVGGIVMAFLYGWEVLFVKKHHD